MNLTESLANAAVALTGMDTHKESGAAVADHTGARIGRQGGFTMENYPAPQFPVWGLPCQDEEAYDVPHLGQDQRIVAVSVYHGQRFADGPGAVVTSYDPRLTFVEDGRQPPDGHRFEITMRGPLALGRAMARRFAEALALGSMIPPSRFPTQDVFMQCGNILVPALKLGIGLPDATVIVSADLLTHPIALGFWQWPVKLPVLEPAGFDWE